MSEEKPIKNSALARHWGVSPPYIRKLVKTKGLPSFTSLEAADIWRQVNAPARTPLDGSSKKGVELEKKIAILPSTTDGETKLPAEPPKTGGKGDGLINVLEFIRTDKDFDSLMIEQAERVPQIAYGLFLRASERGNPGEIAAANKNWHESAKAAAAVRADFLELQERTGALIPLDQVMDIVGTELQALRSALLKFGERCGAPANPADPGLAQRIINAGVDRILQLAGNAETRTRKELEPAPAPVAIAL